MERQSTRHDRRCKLRIGTLGILWLILASAPAPAQECLHYADYLHWVGQQVVAAETSDWFGYLDVAVDGDYAYAAYMSIGLRVIDVSDPADPQPRGELPLTPSPLAVAAGGGHAYVLTGALLHEPGALHAIDVSDPDAPVTVGLLELPARPFELVLRDQHLFIGCGTAGFFIVKVVDPESPEIVGWVDTPGWARDVSIVGSVACVADHEGGVQVLDLSALYDPVILATQEFTQPVLGVALDGNHAYAGLDDGTLQVIDVTLLHAPQIVAAVTTDDRLHDVEVSAGIAYCSNGWDGLLTVDVSTPTAPEILGQPFPLPHGWSEALTLAHGLVYLAELGDQARLVYRAGLQIFDPTHPTPAPYVGARSFGYGGAQRVAAAGDYAYVARSDALYTIDLADPTDPSVVDIESGLESTYGLAIDSGCLYLGEWDVGWEHYFEVFDLDDPAAPAARGRVTTPDLAEGIAVQDCYAYLACNGAGLLTLSITDPDDPQILDMLPLGSYANSIALDGGHACVATNAGLHLIDLSQPAAPVEIADLPLPGIAYDVVIQDEYAYVAVEDYDPGDLAGLVVVEIADPAHPAWVGYVATADFPQHVAVSGICAYVADGRGGMQVIDVSDPSSPVRVGALPTMRPCHQVEFHDGYLLALHSLALQIAWPQCQAAGTLPEVAREGGQPSLLALPNPSRGKVRFLPPGVAPAEPARVSIHDVAGRLVRSWRIEAPSRDLPLDWDGRDRAGAPVGAGCYWVRWSSGSREAGTRLVRLR